MAVIENTFSNKNIENRDWLDSTFLIFLIWTNDSLQMI